MTDCKRILHVEIGGTYGGSLRALELYLAYCDRGRFLHHVLFYFPTPGAERLAALAEKIGVLYPTVPAWLLHGRPQPNPTLTSVKRSLKRTGIGPLLTEGALWMRYLPTFSAVPRLYRWFTRGRYDLIHVNAVPAHYSAAPLAAARLARIPAVTHVRNVFPRNSFNRWQARLSSTLVTVNQGLEKELSSWRINGAIHTCYDAVELATPQESVAQALRSELLGDGKVLVGSVGRLVSTKGFEYLVRAARQVIDARPAVRFAIAGDGPQRAQLEDLIAALNLTGYVHLCGFRPDVANFLSALDLFACSSLQEGLPIAVIEAMMVGKPVVATDVGGIPEAVLPGATGLLVAPGQPEDLAAAILEALERDQARGWPREQIRQSAARISDPRASAERLDEIMEKTIARAPARWPRR